MKDRIPTYPGRVTLVPVEGQANTYDLIRADQPTQTGTPLNKSTLLKDATAELFGLTSDAVPDDALVACAPKIGDIKTTIRTDLDSSWLLCNGAAISANDYPDLYNMSHSFSFWNVDFVSLSNYFSVINCFVFEEGYYVVGGHYNSGNTRYARIAYSTSLNGAWNVKDFWITTADTTYNTITCITRANGYWVIGGKYYIDSSSRGVALSYSVELDGTWTDKILWDCSTSTSSSIGSNDLNGIMYANGSWVAYGRSFVSYKNGARIVYGTDLASTWTTKDFWSVTGSSSSYSTDCEICCGVYKNGLFVFGGQSSNFRWCIAYATLPTQTFSIVHIGNAQNYRTKINCIEYANNYWIVGGGIGSSTRKAAIGYSTDLSGSWVITEVANGQSGSTASDIGISSIIYEQGYFIFAGKRYSNGECYSFVAYSEDITSIDFESFDLWTISSNKIYATNLSLSDGIIYALKNNEAGVAKCNIAKALPSISVDSSYAYIKAKY